MIHSQSQRCAIQLQHAGRKASVCPPWLGLKAVPAEFGGHPNEVQGPNANAWNDNYCTPKEMTEQEIEDVIEAFGAAAKRAVEAGVDVVAVHGAHGYLVHSFASPAVSPLVPLLNSSLRNRTQNQHTYLVIIRQTSAPTSGAAPSKTVPASVSP